VLRVHMDGVIIYHISSHFSNMVVVWPPPLKALSNWGRGGGRERSRLGLFPVFRVLFAVFCLEYRLLFFVLEYCLRRVRVYRTVEALLR